MKLLLLFLLPCLYIVHSVSSSPFNNSWRVTDDEDQSNPWRNQFSSTGSRRTEFLGNNDDSNYWRNQKKSPLNFPKFEFDVKRFPFFSFFGGQRTKNDKKNEEPDVSVNTWEGEGGFINCPPDVPKCIPRLGR